MSGVDGDEELLELGRARRIPTGARVLLAALAAAALVLYLMQRGGGSSAPRAVRTPPPPSTAPTSAPVVSSSRPAALPPWPRRDGACGATAFLPLVSARPLDHHTGVRVLVGDRLVSADIDTGATRPIGLPRSKYATEVATASDGTYALLHSCAGADELGVVVRIGSDGVAH